MAEVFEGFDEDIFSEIDLDFFSQGFDDLEPPCFLPPPPAEPEEAAQTTLEEEAPTTPEEESGSMESDSNSSWAIELEKYLLDDGNGDVRESEEEGENYEEFFAGVFSSEEEAASVEREEKGERKGKRGTDTVVKAEGGDDPMNKKRKRQMRNRDSAMKSRERKKMYVKDLEMKSRFLESECRRLEYSLQCFIAENMALQHRLRNEKACGVSAAKQESAVLFVESLLLGSLFWLLSTVCLFPLPGLQSSNPKDTSSLGKGLVLEVVRAGTIVVRKLRSDVASGLVAMRRKYRGARARMKLCLFPLHAVYA